MKKLVRLLDVKRQCEECFASCAVGHGGCSTSRHSSGSPRRRRGGHGVLYPLLHALMPSPSPGARITSPPNSYILSRCSCTASRLKPWGRFWTSSSSHAHCASANNCTQQMPFSHCVEAWHRCAAATHLHVVKACEPAFVHTGNPFAKLWLFDWLIYSEHSSSIFSEPLHGADTIEKRI